MNMVGNSQYYQSIEKLIKPQIFLLFFIFLFEQLYGLFVCRGLGDPTSQN